MKSAEVAIMIIQASNSDTVMKERNHENGALK